MALKSGLRLHLQVEEPSLEPLLGRRHLRRWILAALDQPAEVTVRIVGRAEGRALNRQFRGRDYATNVLTFAYEGTQANAASISADMVFCGPVIKAEARAQRKRAIDHLAHLVVHSTLHAQGWDHETDIQAERMEALETRILARFRIPDPYQVNRS